MIDAVRLRLARSSSRALLGGSRWSGSPPRRRRPTRPGPSDFRSEVTGIDAGRRRRRTPRSGAATPSSSSRSTRATRWSSRATRPSRSRTSASAPTAPSSATATAAATYVNDDRKGGGTVPAEAKDPEAEPGWEEVGRRRHLRVARPPRPLDGRTSPARRRAASSVGGRVRPVAGPDRGRRHRRPTIEGTLTYEEATSPLPWIALGRASPAALLAWFGRRRARARRGAALAVASRARRRGGPGRLHLDARRRRQPAAVDPAGGRRSSAPSPRWRPRLRNAAVIGSLASVGLPLGLGPAALRGPHQAGAADATCSAVRLDRGARLAAAARRVASAAAYLASPSGAAAKLARARRTTRRRALQPADAS